MKDTSVFDKLNHKLDSRIAELKDMLDCADGIEDGIKVDTKSISPEQIEQLKALFAETNKRSSESRDKFIANCKRMGLTQTEIDVLVAKVEEQSKVIADWIVNHESIHKEG